MRLQIYINALEFKNRIQKTIFNDFPVMKQNCT